MRTLELGWALAQSSGIGDAAAMGCCYGRRVVKRWAACVLLSIAALTGCSSSYEPARSPRIVTVVEDGEPHFVRDATDYGSPMFGRGLGDAVQGNKRAETEARTARNLTIAGFVFDLAGVTSETASLVVLGRARGSKNASLGLALGGIASILVGSALLVSAPPHTYDAVNIYNDGLRPDSPGPRPPQERRGARYPSGEVRA